MSTARIQAAAQLLAALRRGAPRPVSLPAELAPRSQSEAYQVQQETMRLLGQSAGGWKVSMSDADHGTYAPIFSADLLSSGAQLSTPADTPFGVEPEIAFSLRSDLPPLPAGRLYRREEVLDAVGGAHAAIEVVLSRFRSHEGAPALDRLADNISNGALVLAPACTDWRALDLTQLPLRMTLRGTDGERVLHEGRGGHPLADPVLALVWLANQFASHGTGLRAGARITTGTARACTMPSPGSRWKHASTVWAW